MRTEKDIEMKAILFALADILDNCCEDHLIKILSRVSPERKEIIANILRPAI